MSDNIPLFVWNKLRDVTVRIKTVVPHLDGTLSKSSATGTVIYVNGLSVLIKTCGHAVEEWFYNNDVKFTVQFPEMVNNPFYDGVARCAVDASCISDYYSARKELGLLVCKHPFGNLTALPDYGVDPNIPNMNLFMVSNAFGKLWYTNSSGHLQAARVPGSFIDSPLIPTFFQYSMAIGPGSSGGAICNSAGEIVGMAIQANAVEANIFIPGTWSAARREQFADFGVDYNGPLLYGLPLSSILSLFQRLCYVNHVPVDIGQGLYFMADVLCHQILGTPRLVPDPPQAPQAP